ncbi:MAG: replicative DNA helicase [Myxococcales bacterium]|nr:replicative DNA helicase [Myxococcales bacterium]
MVHPLPDEPIPPRHDDDFAQRDFGTRGERMTGRVPPQDLEAERAVLGSILLENSALDVAVEHVDVGYFYKPAHQIVFRAMRDLAEKTEPIDLVTLAAHLRTRDELDVAGGTATLVALSNAVPTAANVQHYAKIVRKHGMLRRLIESATVIVKRAYETDDPDQAVDAAEQAIFEVAQSKAKQGISAIADLVADAFQNIEKLAEQRKAITGVSTGIMRLDHMLSGLQPADLIIIAGRPSMGKTAFSVGVGLHASTEDGRRVAIFSLEMSKESLVVRMLCSEGRIDMSKLRGGFLTEDDWPRLARAAGRLSESKIFVDDTGSISVLELRAKCRRLAADQKREVEIELRREMMERKTRGEEVDEEAYRQAWESHPGLELVIIDYLQLMRGSGSTNSREQEISEISRGLKALAKELNIPVVALSQLNRGVEQRTDKRPGIADLRESGAIEQDADVIMFVYRDEVYNKETEERGVAEIIIGKQRNGPIGTARCKFFHEFTRFDNLLEDAQAGA